VDQYAAGVLFYPAKRNLNCGLGHKGRVFALQSAAYIPFPRGRCDISLTLPG
jgi:hypothetical protein